MSDAKPQNFYDRQRANLAALQKAIPAHPITDPVELNAALAIAARLGHLVSSVSAVDYIPQMHAVSLRYVLLDPDPTKRDTYVSPLFCSNGEVAIGQIGILKIWRQAGGGDAYVRRIDDRLEPCLAHYEVGVNLRGIDGRDCVTIKSREVDLREGSPQAARMKDKQLAQQRENVCTLAETKARLRAIRSALALAQKYTAAELEKPFIVPVLVALVDVSDPMIRRLVAVKALGLEAVLYGRRTLGPGVPGPDGGGVVPVENGSGDHVDTATGEVMEASIVDEDDDAALANEAAGAEAFDPADYAVTAPVGAGQDRCGCPCGCGMPVHVEAAKLTKERGGGVRCGSCWPGARFDKAKHTGMTSLGLTPDFNPSAVTK